MAETQQSNFAKLNNLLEAVRGVCVSLGIDNDRYRQCEAQIRNLINTTGEAASAPARLSTLKDELERVQQELDNQKQQNNILRWHRTSYTIAELTTLFVPHPSVQTSEIDALCANVAAMVAHSPTFQPLLASTPQPVWICLRQALQTLPNQRVEPAACDENCAVTCVQYQKQAQGEGGFAYHVKSHKPSEAD